MTTASIRFVGHATTVLELGGVRIATDPLLRTSLGPLERHGAPPEARWFDDLDAVLVSHGHPDHFDPWSLGRMAGRGAVVVPRGLGRAAARAVDGEVVEVVAGERFAIGRVEVEVVPARHWMTPGHAARPARRLPAARARLAVGLLRRRHRLVPGPRPPRRPRRRRAAPGLDVGAAPRAGTPGATVCRGGAGAARRGGCRADPLGHALPAAPVAGLGPAAPPARVAVRGPRLAIRAGGRRPGAPAGRERRLPDGAHGRLAGLRAARR